MEFLERTRERVPALAEYLDGPFDLAATDMLDVDWMRARVADTAVRWQCSDARVNATLWWYSASSTMAFVPIATAMVSGKCADPQLDGARCFLLPDGYLGGTTSERTISTDELPRALDAAFTSVIATLSAASGAREQALWAVASDSIANRSLDVGAALGDRAAGSDFASSVVGKMHASVPVPRFVDVGGRRFVRRSSCCLLYETESADMCVSCPRRTPADRLQGLRAAARYR